MTERDAGLIKLLKDVSDVLFESVLLDYKGKENPDQSRMMSIRARVDKELTILQDARSLRSATYKLSVRRRRLPSILGRLRRI